jgi:hypothetical protein
MTIDFTAVTDAQITAQLRLYQQRFRESLPNLDVRRGPIHDLVLLPQAMIEAARQQEIERYLSARSVRDALVDPTLADADTLDGNLSNWGLTRRTGAKAHGQLVIVLSRAISVTISRGATFTANGQTFVTLEPFTSKSLPELVNSSTDRLLTQLANSTYGFVIEVEAQVAGAAGMLRKDTLVEPDSKPSSFMTAYVAADFQGGLDTESNDIMLTKLLDGLASKTISNRSTMRALLRSQPAFNSIVRSSVVGLGNAEMVRDRHGIVPVSQGGRADWYVRTQATLYRVPVTKAATLINKQDSGFGVWQVALGAELPGFYEVRHLRPAGAALGSSNFDLSADLRGYNLAQFAAPPDLHDSVEGVYTAAQTVFVRFVDTTTPVAELAIGATQEYDMELVGLPLISDLQTYVGSADISHYGGDVLIKAPVPCFVSVTFDVHKRATDGEIDTAAVQTAIVEAVHATEFIGCLYASRLADVISRYLPANAGLGAIDMLGRVRYPDGRQRMLRNPVVLQIPDDPDQMVSARTVQFFVDLADVIVNIRNTVPVEV